MFPARRLVSGVVGAVLTSGLVLVTSPGHGAPDDDPTYTHELQARTNLLINDEGFNLPPGSSFNSINPSLNDQGVVAFPVQVVHDRGSGEDRPGLWVGTDGDGSVVHRGDITERISADVSLNQDGQVAFTLGNSGSVDNGLWVQDPDDGAVRRTSLPITPSSHSTPTMTSDGTVVSKATLGEGNGWVATSPDNAGVLIAADQDVLPDSPYDYLYTPAANDAGQVAGKVGIQTGDFGPVEIRRFDIGGESVRLVANRDVDPTSTYTAFDNSLGINDNGTVAVVAKKSNGTRALLRIDENAVHEVVVAASDKEIRSIDYFAPDINNADQIVFRGKDADGQGIYVVDADGTLTKVIGTNDEVETDQGLGMVAQHDGSNVFGGAPEINASGDVVFTAALTPADDKMVEWGTGVFVAHADGGTAPVRGTLHGTVTDATTGDPVAEATIKVRATDGATTSTRSGSDGTYDLDLAPGDYAVTTTAPGLDDARQQVSIIADQSLDLVTQLTSPGLDASPGNRVLEPALWRNASTTVTVTNSGSTDLAWTATENAGWVKLSGAKGSLAPGDSATVKVTVDRTGKRAGSYTAPIKVSAKGLAPVVSQVTMKVAAADVAVNVGGPAYAPSKKLTWRADRKLGKGNYGHVGKLKVQRTKRPIAHTLADKLFRTRGVGKQTYRVRGLPAGKYTMTLGFVEHTKVKKGQRTFNVFVDGKRVLRKYDVRRHATPLRAHTKKITVTHKGKGDLVVALRGVKGQPILSALRLREK